MVVVEPKFLRWVFLVTLAAWMVLPFTFSNEPAVDVIPLVVAGELVSDAPASVYSATGETSHSTTAIFRSRACGLTPPGTDCDSAVVPFSHPPIALPLAILFSNI